MKIHMLSLSYDNTDFQISRFDKVIEWLLVGLLVFMPLAFGAVYAWGEEIVVALTGAIVICFLLKLIYHPKEKIIWTWAYLPAGIFLFVVVLQLIPLPCAFLRIISPGTVSLRGELLSGIPDAEGPFGFMPLSLYPNATLHDLRLLLAILAVFVVVVNVYRRPVQIKKLLMFIALIGGFICLLALAQYLFWNGKIYWLVATKYSGVKAGPFINHSHYGQFMNLSIGAALGLVMVKLHEQFKSKHFVPSDVFVYLGSADSGSLWLLVGVIVVGLTTIFISLTRGGIVGMLIAFAFTVLMLSRRHSLRRGAWMMVLMALIAFSCVLYIGFDVVYERLASLYNLQEYECRWQILKDLTSAFARFPVLGTGLGTHSVVYPMFDRSYITALATHAENEYAQAMEETGLIGLAALVFLGVVVWRNYVRNIKQPGSSIRFAAYGLGFGLLAILIHSLSDFGQHIPANAFLSAVFCALLISLSYLSAVADTRQNKETAQGINLFVNSRSVRLMVLILISGIWLWSLVSADKARLAESNWRKVLEIERSLVEKNWNPDLSGDAEYANLISFASRASNYQPRNVNYLYWLNVYRWRSVSRQTNPQTGEALIAEDSMPVVRDIVKQLRRACVVCPTYGPTYCVLGQIEKSVLGEALGAENIRKGFSLAPCDAAACFVAGCLDVEEGEIDQSIEKFDRVVRLDSGSFNSIADMYIDGLDRIDLAVTLAGEEPRRLNYVSRKLAGNTSYEHLVEEIDAKAKSLLEDKCSIPDTPAWAFASLAGLYRKYKSNELAERCYRSALALDYSQVNWRFSLAQLLAQMGRKSDAMHEARICLRFRPDFQAARELIARLSVEPGVLAESFESVDISP